MLLTAQCLFSNFKEIVITIADPEIFGGIYIYTQLGGSCKPPESCIFNH